MEENILLDLECVIFSVKTLQIVVTPPSLEPMTSRTAVQRSTTKPKVRTLGSGA